MRQDLGPSPRACFRMDTLYVLSDTEVRGSVPRDKTGAVAPAFAIVEPTLLVPLSTLNLSPKPNLYEVGQILCLKKGRCRPWGEWWA